MSSFVRDPSTGKFVRPMKLKYSVELFLELGSEAMMSGKSFREFFSQSRDGVARGLLRLVRSVLA